MPLPCKDNSISSGSGGREKSGWMEREGQRISKTFNTLEIKYWETEDRTFRSVFPINKFAPSSNVSSTSQPSITRRVNCFRLTKSCLKSNIRTVEKFASHACSGLISDFFLYVVPRGALKAGRLHLEPREYCPTGILSQSHPSPFQADYCSDPRLEESQDPGRR